MKYSTHRGRRRRGGSGPERHPAAIATIAPSGTASADVCASAGRRISVSGCANLGDVMAPYVPPPGYYAPMPGFQQPGRQWLRRLERPLGQRQHLQLGPDDERPRAEPAGRCRLRSDRSRSNRSLFITLTHAATKSLTNFSLASSSA